MTVAAGHIAKSSNRGEITAAQRFQRQSRLHGGVAGHGVVKPFAVVAVLSCVLECHDTEFPEERVLFSLPDHGRQVLPKRVVLWPLFQPRHRLQRLRMLRSQEIASAGKRKSLR